MHNFLKDSRWDMIHTHTHPPLLLGCIPTLSYVLVQEYSCKFNAVQVIILVSIVA